MSTEQALGLGVFALGIAANAGIVWKGLGIVEKELLRLRGAVHHNQNQTSKTLGSMEADIEDLKDEVKDLKEEVERLTRKVFGN